MKIERWMFLSFCGFAAIFAFIALILVPQISDLRTRQLDLRMTRARIVLYSDLPNNEPAEQMHVLSRDQFFVSLANVRAAALKFGLDVSAFTATDVNNFGIDVTETIVRVTLTGIFDDAIDYVNYLVSGVYNIRYLSLVNTETTGFDVMFSIFHDD